MKAKRKHLLLILMVLSIGLINIVYATQPAYQHPIQKDYYINDYKVKQIKDTDGTLVQNGDYLEMYGGKWTNAHLVDGRRDGNWIRTEEEFYLLNKRLDTAYQIISEKYTAFGTRIGEIYAGKTTTTHHSWAGTFVIPNNTMLYHTEIFTEDGIKEYLCTGNYYDQSGSQILFENETPMTSELLEKFEEPQAIDFRMWDNYGSENAILIAKELEIKNYNETAHPHPVQKDYYINDYKVYQYHDTDGELVQDGDNLYMYGGEWTNAHLVDGRRDGNWVRTEDEFYLLNKRIDTAFTINSSNYTGLATRLGKVFAGKLMTTDHSWANSLVIPNGTTIYQTRLVTDDKIIEYMATGNYYDQSGAEIFYEHETAMTEDMLAKLQQPQYIGFDIGDNYGSDSALMIAREILISNFVESHPQPVQKDYYINDYKVKQIKDTDGTLVQNGDHLEMYGGKWTNAHLVDGRRDGNWIRTEEEFYLLNKRLDTAYQIISEKYTAFGTRIGEIYAGKTTTTHHSWAGTFVIPNNTMLYHTEIFTEDGIKEYLCTGNYYDQSGSQILFENETPMTSELLEKFKKPQAIDFRMWDNYGSENSILIAKAIKISNNEVKQTHQDYPQPTADNAIKIKIDSYEPISVFNGITGITIFYNHPNNYLGYRVYRSEKANELGISITDFYITADKFTDVNVEPNTTYYYTIKPILEEANPLAGKHEVLGSSLAKWTIRTPKTEFGIFSTNSVGKTRNFIMLKINDANMSVNGLSQEVDPGRGTAPIIVKGRTMVPIRAIVEAMFGTVGWNGSEQKVTLSANSNKVDMWINQKRLVKNGAESKVDVPPSIINGRTFVPLRFGAENLNCQVDWINSQKSIVIVWYE